MAAVEALAKPVAEPDVMVDDGGADLVEELLEEDETTTSRSLSPVYTMWMGKHTDGVVGGFAGGVEGAQGTVAGAPAHCADLRLDQARALATNSCEIGGIRLSTKTVSDRQEWAAGEK